MNHGEEPSSKKRPRFVWTDECRARFVKVVKKLGKDAVPKKILLAMNEPGLTREIVGSHLQKHRENKKKREREERQLCERRHINNRILVPPVVSSAYHGMLHLHLLQASTTDSPPPPQPQMQRHHYNHQHLACQPQIQHEHHEQHLARQPMQFNNFDGVTSLIGNGSNNLTSMHQHDQKPVLSFQVNTTGPAMHQPDRITSFKSNMPQQLDQNPSSVSGIINQDQALGTPLGRSNMEQLDQNRSLGTSFEKSNMERQPITQNLTSGTQQLDQNPGTQQLDQSQSSGSGIINQNHALGSSFERINMEQQPITQNLTSGTQQLDQNPGTQQLHQSQSSGSGIINQNHGLGTFFERINMEEQPLTANLTSSTQQLDQTSYPPIRSGYDGMSTPKTTLVDEYEFVDGLFKPFEEWS